MAIEASRADIFDIVLDSFESEATLDAKIADLGQPTLEMLADQITTVIADYLESLEEVEYITSRKFSDQDETVHIIGKYDEDNYLEEL